MPKNRTIFSQLLDFIPRREFSRCVTSHQGHHNVRSFSCWDQFLCMLFAQFTCRDSLRDIEVCLRGMSEKLYRIGLRGKVSRSTLADANDRRSSQIYGDFCKILINKAQRLYSNDSLISELVSFAYALDTSWIRLCLSLCPWAQFGKEKRAFVKLHTLLDLRGNIPSFIAVSAANINDFEGLDYLTIVPGAFYVMDKGYFDLARLRKLKEACAYFVIRKKKHVKVTGVSSSYIEDKTSGVQSDHIVKFRGKFAKRKYPDQIRLIKFRDLELNRTFLFLTNNFNLPPLIICQLYKERWQIELFFRWIKQHLRVTKFYGTSLNAVETQIWIATSAFLLVAIAKKELCIKAPLYQILQFISLSLFEEKPILLAFSEIAIPENSTCLDNQLNLF